MYKIYPINLKLDTDTGTHADELASCIKQGKLKVEQETLLYNTSFCFNYALQNEALDNCEDAHEFMMKTGYEYSNIREAEKGDIIVFYKLSKTNNFAGARQSKHYAIIKDINLAKGRFIIISKWGLMAVYSGQIDYLPKCYGTHFAIFKKKNALLRRQKEEISVGEQKF